MRVTVEVDCVYASALMPAVGARHRRRNSETWHRSAVQNVRESRDPALPMSDHKDGDRQAPGSAVRIMKWFRNRCGNKPQRRMTHLQSSGLRELSEGVVKTSSPIFPPIVLSRKSPVPDFARPVNVNNSEYERLTCSRPGRDFQTGVANEKHTS